MILYLIISLFLSGTYIFIILLYITGWKALPHFRIPENYRPLTRISVVIAARNEEENISDCLQSIFDNNYPSDLLEVIVVDDHSTDGTADCVRKFTPENLRFFQLADFLDEQQEQSFKKKAIELGIEKADGQLIVTTDADCIVPKDWLLYFAAFYETKKVKMIAAPVNFYPEQSIFEAFQSLDFMGMMGISGAGIQRSLMYMCNGANLAYERAAFYEVAGFAGIDQKASGDDMLLMQKMAQQFPRQIGYLKNAGATTFTKAMSSPEAFFQQRLRWASKSGVYSGIGIQLILAAVYFFCCNILIGIVLIPFLGWTVLKIIALQILIKSVADFIFLSMMADFFESRRLMRFFLPSQFLHICYIVIIGTFGNLKKQYYWKGRRTA